MGKINPSPTHPPQVDTKDLPGTGAEYSKWVLALFAVLTLMFIAGTLAWSAKDRVVEAIPGGSSSSGPVFDTGEGV